MKKKNKLIGNNLVIKGLQVLLEEKVIIKNLDLTIKPGEFHVIMGPNGSGKSTLTQGIMGSPSYQVSAKTMQIGKVNLLGLDPEARAKAGLMLAFQNPIAVPGVTISNLLRTAYKEIYTDATFSPLEFHKKLQTYADILKFPHEFLRRAVNDGFSGGEKKKVEMLQLLALQPKFAMLDEIDTGLDVDALKLVSKGITALQKTGCGILLITHYQRILNYVSPEFVHVLKDGVIVKEGGMEIVKQIEEEGYEHVHGA